MNSVIGIISLCFMTLVAVGAPFGVPHLWREKGPPPHEPTWWPIGLPPYSDLHRAAPTGVMGAVALVIAGWCIFLQERGYPTTIPAFVFMGLFALDALIALSVALFSHPKALVPPGRRGEEGWATRTFRPKPRRSGRHGQR